MAIINGQVISIAPEAENIPITSAPTEDMEMWIDPSIDNAEGADFAEVDHNHDEDYDVKGAAAAVQGNLDAHTGNKSNPHGVTAEQIGAAKEDHNHDGVYATAISTATVLPSSGTALTDNTIYNVNTAVGTYQFAPPANGWAHGKFTTGTSVAITFASGSFAGAVPEFAASTTYEFDVLDGVWAFAEVVSQ